MMRRCWHRWRKRIVTRQRVVQGEYYCGKCDRIATPAHTRRLAAKDGQ